MSNNEYHVKDKEKNNKEYRTGYNESIKSLINN